MEEIDDFVMDDYDECLFDECDTVYDELESDGVYDDSFVNAQEFRILRGHFLDELQKEQFNEISNNIRDQILQILDTLTKDDLEFSFDNLTVLKKWALLPEKEQISFRKKAQITVKFLKKTHNVY